MKQKYMDTNDAVFTKTCRVFYSICLVLCLPIFLDGLLPAISSKEIVTNTHVTHLSGAKYAAPTNAYVIETRYSEFVLGSSSTKDIQTYKNVFKGDTLLVKKSRLFDVALSFENQYVNYTQGRVILIISRIAFFLALGGLLFFTNRSKILTAYVIATGFFTCVYLVFLLLPFLDY